jgi:hypothetical protein
MVRAQHKKDKQKPVVRFLAIKKLVLKKLVRFDCRLTSTQIFLVKMMIIAKLFQVSSVRFLSSRDKEVKLIKMLKLRNLIKSSTQLRMFSSSPVVSPFKQKHERQIDMQQALLDAEKVAGCSTSLINLRWVTSQNILNFIMLLRNLSAENNKNTMLQTLA